MNNKEDKNSSLLRNFLRCAVSSIVYHRLFELTDLGEGVNVPFVKRSFAGIPNVIQMLPTTEDGQIIHDDVYIISNWLENGVFPCIELGHVQALTIILTTKPCKSDEQPLGHHSLIELFRFQMERIEKEEETDIICSRNITKAGMRGALEELRKILTTDFDDACSYDLEKIYFSFILEYRDSAPKTLKQSEWFSHISSFNPLAMLESNGKSTSPTLYLAQSTPNHSKVTDQSTEKVYAQLASWKSTRDEMILMHKRHVSSHNWSVERILNPISLKKYEHSTKKRKRSIHNLSPKALEEIHTEMMFDEEDSNTPLREVMTNSSKPPPQKLKRLSSKKPSSEKEMNTKTPLKKKKCYSKTPPTSKEKNSKTPRKKKNSTTESKTIKRSYNHLHYHPLSFITPKYKSPYFYSTASEVPTLLVSVDSSSSLSFE